MDIEFLGGNCFRVKTKSAIIIVDDTMAKMGGKSPQTDATVALYTNPQLRSGVICKSRLVIDSPGEFEIGDLTVQGVQVRSHMDEEGTLLGTAFQLRYAGQTVTLTGHIYPDVPAELSELAGGTDVLIIPVGGNGYTLDPTGAASIVKSLEPGVVIPSHYEIDGLNYEVPAQPLSEFTKVLSGDSPEQVDTFKVAKSDDATSQTRVVILAKRS